MVFSLPFLGMFDLVKNWLNDVIGEIYDYASGAGMIKILNEMVTDYRGFFNANGTVGATLGEIQTALKVVGISICVLYFIMALVDLGMSDRMTLELFIKFFSKFAVGIGCIQLCDAFCTLGMGLSNEVSAIISNTNLGGDANINADKEAFIEAMIKGLGKNWLIIIATSAIFIFLLTILYGICTIVVYVICFTRLIEMCLRAVFMPVALGAMSDDGFKGAGGRYIKKFIALCLQGPALIAIGQIMGTLCTNMMTYAVSNSSAGLFAAFIPSLGVTIASIGVMFKSIGIINDVMGG